jgi:hypothetical protein
MFPELFNDRGLIEYYQYLVERNLLIIAMVIREEDHAEELAEINEWLLMQNLPNNYDPNSTENEEVGITKRYDSLCVLMQDNGVGNPKGETVNAFYSRVDYLKKKFKPKSKPVK